MAKNINHLQHVKSNVVEEGLPKLPQPSVLVEGEIAVNYAAGYETLSIKNSSGEVVTFSSNNYYSEKKLGSGFTGQNSGVTVTQAMNNTNKVVAAALNDLNGRKLDASAYTPTDLSDYATKQWVNEERLGSGFTGENSGVTVTQVIEDDELAISAALNDLDGRKLDVSAYTPTDLSNYYDKNEIDGFLDDFGETLNGKVSSITINNGTKVSSNGNVNLGTVVSSMTVNGSAVTVTNGAAALTGLATTSELLKYADKAEYDSSDKKIYFKNGNTTLTSMTIDATDFIKDGMVNAVSVSGVTSGESVVDCLVITFNTDAGNENINIPLSEIFDSTLYYTKTEIDNVLGSGFTVSAVTSSVTDVIRENEIVVSSALNDLDGRKLDASAYTQPDLSAYATKQWVNEERLGSGFTGENSGVTVTQAMNSTNKVVAAALNDLNSRKLDASAYTPTDLSGYYTKQEIDGDKLGSGFTGENSGVTVTQTINDLNERKLDASAYTQPDLSVYATKQWIEDDVLGSGFTTGDYSGKSISEVIEENELIIASALNDLNDKPPIPTVNDNTITLTFNGSTVGTFTLNQNTDKTIDIGTIIGLPSFSAANNGQILGVVNGALTWITPTTIYSGSGTPSSSQGNDGDIYLQTS